MRDFFGAIDRYDGFREASFEVSMDAFRARVLADETVRQLRDVAIQLTAIDESVLYVLRKRGPTIFPWERLHGQFRSHIKRFEVAIWANGRLEGLSYGRPSNGPHNVTIHFVERIGCDKSLLKSQIIPIVADVATSYATVLGKDHVLAKGPVDGAIPSYLAVGFQHWRPIGAVKYLERRVVK